MAQPDLARCDHGSSLCWVQGAIHAKRADRAGIHVTSDGVAVASSPRFRLDDPARTPRACANSTGNLKLAWTGRSSCNVFQRTRSMRRRELQSARFFSIALGEPMADEKTDEEERGKLIGAFYELGPKVPINPSQTPIRTSRTVWAAIAAAGVSVSFPSGVAAWGWLTWSNVDDFGHTDNAPRRACAAILMLTPFLLCLAALYFFVTGAVLRGLRIPTFAGMASMALCLSAGCGALGIEKGSHDSVLMGCTVLVPLVSGSIVYWWMTRVARPRLR